MQKIAAALLLTALLIPYSSHAAGTAPLAPGKPAGVVRAQMGGQTLAFVGGGLALIAGMTLLITDGKLAVTSITGGAPATNAVSPTTTSR